MVCLTGWGIAGALTSAAVVVALRAPVYVGEGLDVVSAMGCGTGVAFGKPAQHVGSGGDTFAHT